MSRTVNEKYVDPTINRWINEQIAATCNELSEYGPSVSTIRFTDFDTLDFDVTFTKPIIYETEERWSDNYSIKIPEEYKAMLKVAEKLSQ